MHFASEGKTFREFHMFRSSPDFGGKRPFEDVQMAFQITTKMCPLLRVEGGGVREERDSCVVENQRTKKKIEGR